MKYKLEQYEALIYRWVKPFIGSYDIDDLLQEGRMALWTAIQKYDKNRGSFIPYIHTCVRNHIINTVTRQSTLITNNPSPQNIYIQDEEPIEHLLPNLTQFQINIIKMRQMGYTYEEMASILNMSSYKTKQIVRQIIDIIRIANV